MNKKLLLSTIFIMALGFGVFAFYFKSKKINYPNAIFIKERIELCNLNLRDSVYEQISVMNVEKVFNPYFLFVEYPMHFIFDISNFKVFIVDENGKIRQSFFSSGRGASEIMMGKFTKKPVNGYLCYADRQNVRISVANYLKPNEVSVVKLDFIPDAVVRVSDSLYLVRSTDTDSALSLVSSKGKILRQFCSFSNFNLGNREVRKSPMTAVVYQGGLCCKDSLVLIYNMYGSKMCLYSLFISR